MDTPTTDHELLLPEEAAQLLRLSEKTIRRRILDGSLPGYRIKGTPGGLGQVRVRRADVLALLEPIAPAVKDVPGSPGAGEDTDLQADRGAAPYADEEQHIDPADLDPEERADTIAGVKRGLASTRHRPWSEVAAEMRARYGIAE